MCSSPTSYLFSKVEAAYFRGQINDSQAAPVPLLPIYELNGAPTAAQVLIMGPDDFIVAMASSYQNLAQRIIGTRKEVGVG